MKQTIELACRGPNGNQVIRVSVEADVRGFLALHKHHVFDDEWVVTHIPTGLSACSGISTKRDAMACMRDLLACGANWDFTDPNTVKKFQKSVLTKIKSIKLRAQGLDS